MHSQSYVSDTTNQPDPATDPQFYEGVTSRRLIAWFIDAVIIGVATMVVYSVTTVITFGLGAFLFPVIFLGVSFVYRAALLATGSATWGMAMMGIEFRDIAGRRLDGGTAFAHTLIYTIAFAFFIVQLLSIASMLMTPKGKAIQDHLLGTVAINKPL